MSLKWKLLTPVVGVNTLLKGENHEPVSRASSSSCRNVFLFVLHHKGGERVHFQSRCVRMVPDWNGVYYRLRRMAHLVDNPNDSESPHRSRLRERRQLRVFFADSRYDRLRSPTLSLFRFARADGGRGGHAPTRMLIGLAFSEKSEVAEW